MQHTAPARLAWVTLGLLAASWLILLGQFIWLTFFQTTGAAGELLLLGVLWLFTTGPYLLLGYAVIRGGRDIDIIAIALIFAVLSAGVLLILLLVALTGLELITSQTALSSTALLWISGWLFGLLTAVMARHRQDR